MHAQVMQFNEALDYLKSHFDYCVDCSNLDALDLMNLYIYCFETIGLRRIVTRHNFESPGGFEVIDGRPDGRWTHLESYLFFDDLTLATEVWLQYGQRLPAIANLTCERIENEIEERSSI